MTLWQGWLQRPQSVWIRKVLFQIHLWMGIGLGVYVVVISISGSAIVYSRDIHRRGHYRTIVVTDSSGPRMQTEELQRRVRQAYPGYDLLSVTEPEKPDQPDVAILQRRRERIERLFNPYSGADLGDPRSRIDRVFSWLTNLHDNLLLGLSGRTWNGVGSFLLTLMSLTGAVIWWPGSKNWRRSMKISRRARFARVNWDLHSAVGFWCFLLVLIWGVSGICLCFPGVLDSFLGRGVRLWITRLHFGRFNGVTEALWTILGLAPAVLACTGALMWWNRVLGKKLRSWRSRRTDMVPREAAPSAAEMLR